MMVAKGRVNNSALCRFYIKNLFFINIYLKNACNLNLNYIFVMIFN